MNHEQMVSFIWSTADLIRDTFKRGKYQDVILPLTVLRRLDCVLAPTKKKVLEVNAKYRDKLDNLDPQLRRASGFAFYNTSRYDFDKLLADAPNIAQNLRNYIAGFSENMREVLSKFDFDNTISKLDEAGLLFMVLERFKNIDFHPDRIPNYRMGDIFETLIRKFNEALNENPGEHFTPRDVIHLMADLLIAGDEDRLAKAGTIITICDPCCGTGGMLTITKNRILGTDEHPGINPDADVHLFGQEVNPETFAVCKSDLFMKSKSGRDAENILYGSTLSNDKHSGRSFEYLIANPPYGKDWKRDEEAVKTEYERGTAGRFEAGHPRISDGQLLFLQHMLFHCRKPEEGGARIAIIMNGSPLFTGDSGSGESEIRRWLLENDWLDTLVALPEQLFFNTGIATYVWILTNRKEKRRKGKVLLIDATSFWTSMKKSLGAKRRMIPEEQAYIILKLYHDFEETEHSRIYSTTHFGFRKIRVERPLKLNFQVNNERINVLREERAFQNLTTSRKKDPEKKHQEIEAGRELQTKIIRALESIPDMLYKNSKTFLTELKKSLKLSDLSIKASLRTAILRALSERDETADTCLDSSGNSEPDTDLRDYERVPLDKDIYDYLDKEVRPHVPDAWIDTSYTDDRDGNPGKVGYEINFNRYFYKYQPPRPLDEINADIKQIENETYELLKDMLESEAAKQ